MSLDVGTRMFSGLELNTEMTSRVGQGAASPTFTGTTTVDTLVAGATTTTTLGVTTFTASSTVTLSPASKNIAISPSGTGTVTISPVGALTVNPTAASTIDNASIGVTTPLAGKFTTLTATGLITGTTYIDQSVGNALSGAGTLVSDATQLAKQINNVTTAASGTGVILPLVSAAGIGGIVIVNNAGANALKVYGAGSDTIDGVAAGTGVALTNGKRAMYIPVAAATWISAQLGVVSA